MHLPIRAGARGAETTGRKRSVSGPKILLVIGGGIAAYKSCELVRLIRKAGGEVTCVLTDGGQQFVTPMALAALSENKVYTSLFDLKDEVEMGHIQLSREADLVVVCPATADLLAKMAAGIADDLATTLILATDKPVLTVPAMNVRMWEHSATQRNADWLRQAGVAVMDPDEGPMACGEFGAGRMPEPPSILARIAQELDLDLDLPELAAPAPAQLAAPLAGDKSPDEGPLSEDWAEEPEMDEEAEDEAPSNGGLGGLLSMIIPRTTETRTHDEIEAELEALPEAEEEAAAEEPLDLPAPDPAAGPILATKGKAAAAPPTDPSALAYDHGAGLQSVQTQSVTFENSPLAGQGAFDPDPEHRPLYGKHVLITAGPTREPIDPVRYIANRSSGKQGFAIAAMAAAAGARVTLIAGPVHLPTPVGVDRIDVETAEDMAEEVRRALPVDIAFMVAAVADWKSRHVAGEKMKKRGSAPPALILAENPDILASTAAGRKRPTLLIGFAAETENVVENAKSKRKRKGADWIVANNVAGDVGESVMGGDLNQVHIVTAGGVESLPEMAKEDVARELVLRAAEALAPVEESDD
ncbi:bifunctional phosphopantothenoylcysteine decarboxylase/phosphopantothenate synthase [Qipengyuania flava]|uniref:bifunctional phosphopantothenoylcysteine decarboxylase/phosphopantothenate synthase n=1 Tax=Qipengyuania flava TaxID=192812 RepID=UPI001C5869E1|nr:bifunctional phosphopantothenoylcysteine decarboxylase/phosphopantothenate synthase [Qipengyuania flava]MBW3167247.1 bifunctional phosphopantothenoylcysteine decarboxylase/phosphopantothenate synthase [Qipengyuania flava]MBY5964485.1 bifunctional phosphopantothenoylcysteine decarboxylase/phosphopantothenate synthase [Qipengyuania flava]MBY6010809.1 bifunctional phosphopantothenoylcysteine decarboxylase/phosphopantothenate synthase [Qipengyuania flava]MBY6025251.1 bifunctional phosphopantothe